MPLQLNGYQVSLSHQSIEVFESTIETSKIKETREKLGKDWFSYYQDGSFYTLAKVESAENPLGKAVTLDLTTHKGMKFAAAMIAEAIENCFPDYDAVRHRPFAFLAQKAELVSEATKGWTAVPELVKEFEIRPKYELDPRLTEIHDGNLQIVLTLGLATRWICNADLKALADAGVVLSGLHVIRREVEPGQRRLVGRIKKLDGEDVILSETYDKTSSIPASDVRLEGSKESFSICLNRLLGQRYSRYYVALDKAQGKLSDGPGMEKAMTTMGGFLRKQNPIGLPGGLSFEIGNQVRIENNPDFKAFINLKPSMYCFDRSRTKLADYAWQGLERHGPYDRESFPKRTPRILVVCPDKVAGRISQTMRLFRDGITSVERSRFASGLAGTFRLVNPEFVNLPVQLFGVENKNVAKAYRDAIEDMLARDSAFDAAFNILLDEHSDLQDKFSPYLVAKSVLLSNGIPVQEAKSSTLIQTPDRLQYILQNVALALYAKMGGIPWTVDHGETVDDELVIGLGGAELSGSRFEKRQRHIGITTVFRGDGNYLLSNLSRECSYDQYPEVLRESSAKVLREVKARNGWKPGHTVRVVFHAFKPLKNIEIADIIASSVQEIGSEQNVEFAFLTVSHDHSFILTDNAQSGIVPRYGNKPPKGVNVPQRGTVVQLGKYTRLLCTTGPRMVKRPELPLPRPLLLHLHKQSTYRDFPYLSDQVLKFTALSWRSTLPTDRPVTILYSSLIAALLGRLQSVSDWSPAVLNTKLRNSKWFL